MSRAVLQALERYHRVLCVLSRDADVRCAHPVERAEGLWRAM
jgi:hypothetical protein